MIEMLELWTNLSDMIIKNSCDDELTMQMVCLLKKCWNRWTNHSGDMIEMMN